MANDTHPTEVAVGSQDTLFYDYENFPGSRFAHAFVAANYETLKLTGKRGEGFVFDTNALHRAVVDAAADSRSVVLFEVDGAAKSDALQNASERHHPPCPGSSRQYLQELP